MQHPPEANESRSRSLTDSIQGKDFRSCHGLKLNRLAPNATPSERTVRPQRSLYETISFPNRLHAHAGRRSSDSDSLAGSDIRISVCIDSGGAVCGPTASQQRIPGDI